MSSIFQHIKTPDLKRRAGLTACATLILVTLADRLLYGRGTGLNIAVVTVAVALGIAGLSTHRWQRTTTVLASLLGGTVILVIEHAGPVAVTLTLTALALFSLERHVGHPAEWTRWPRLLVAFWLNMPLRFIRDILTTARVKRSREAAPELIGRVGVWIVPVGLGFVFLFLFRAANPLVEMELSRFNPAIIVNAVSLTRIMFWLAAAVVIWAYLRPRIQITDAPQHTVEIPSRGHGILFGPAATSRALVIFNLMFAVQTGLDITYLWGGISLPEGMSYAEYAHRGVDGQADWREVRPPA